MTEQTSFPLSFHSTIRLSGEQLADAIRTAEKQEDMVMTVFEASPSPLSPSQVLAICERAGKRLLLTSVRRAISNLTTARALEKTDALVMGPYKKPEYLWRVAS